MTKPRIQKVAALAALLLTFASITTTHAAARDVREVSINGKRFLVLPEEDPPEEMSWKPFGEEIESYLGISAISNGAAVSGREYQCTELVHRFLREMYGFPTRIGLGLGHGKDLARGIGTRFGSPFVSSGKIAGRNIRLEYFESGASRFPPVVGSVVSMHFSNRGTGYGHVGVIRTLDMNSDGSLSGYLFDQHGSIHKTVGIPIRPDTVIFTVDEDNVWSGVVHSWKYERDYPVVGWTNVVIVE